MSRRVAERTAIAVGLALVTGCSDTTGPQRALLPGLTGLVVSQPAGRSIARSGALSVRSDGPVTGSAVYVSMVPGSVPSGVEATIRDQANGQSVTAPVVNGGFDPVAIPASVGDTLLVEISRGGSAQPVRVVELVRAKRPPVVIRTNPPAGGRDVPLNARMEIVFSEPMDSSVLGTDALQIVRGARRVVGTATFLDDRQLGAVIVPSAPLALGTDYQLVVGVAARGLDGEALASAVTVPFTTATTAAPPPTDQIAFTGMTAWADGGGAGDIYVMNGGGTDVRRLTNSHTLGSWAPAWSPDGRKLAFVSLMHEGQSGPGDPAIYVMNADGSGVRRVTFGPGDDEGPAWSPDGQRIAFSREECLTTAASSTPPTCGAFGSPAVYVMNADGSNLTRLASAAARPSWSPDGSRLAVSVGSGIAVMTDDGSGFTMLMGGAAEPAWSPDGARIAFVIRGDIHVANADGSGARRLATGDWPAWSPDGSQLVFEGPSRLLTVNVTDGTVTDLNVAGYYAAWSPPGRIAPTRPAPALQLQKLDGDLQQGQVAAALQAPFRVRLMRDGAPVAARQVAWTIRRVPDLPAEGDSLSGVTALTDAGGVSSATFTLGTEARGYVVEAAVAGAAGSPVTFTASALPGTAVSLVMGVGSSGSPSQPQYAGDAQVGLVGRSLGGLYIVHAVDRIGNLAPGVAVEWAIASGGGTISPPPFGDPNQFAVRVLGNSAGRQTATATAPSIPGSPTVTFTAGAADAVVGVGWTDLGDCHNGFTNANVTVARGSTVGWGWTPCDADGSGNGQAHDVTFEDDPTSPVSSGVKTWGFHLRTFATPGTYRYRCTLHTQGFGSGESETGTVTVLP